MEIADNLKQFLQDLPIIKQYAINIREFFNENPEIEKK